MNKIVFIIGQTASGKSDLALSLAKTHKIEIICADSRTVYIDADIGTAKPSKSDQKKVQHHCLDLVTPDKIYSVAQFQKDSKEAISDIWARNNTPFVVGGTGLYIDSLYYEYIFDDKNKDPLDYSLSLEKLANIAENRGLVVPSETLTNKQHLIRFIERNGVSKKGKKMEALVVGMKLTREQLKSRIQNRVDQMFDFGLVTETENIIKKYGNNCSVLKAPAYKSVVGMLDGTYTEQEAKDMFVSLDMKLAKKQETWFKRNSDIHWCHNPKEAEQLISQYLVQ